MYKINYVSNLVKLNKNRVYIYKALKIFNIILQISIIGLILQSVNFYVTIKEYNTDIEKVKKTIEEKREKNSMDKIEKRWNDNYFKVLAVKQQLSARTNYGLILKSFAEALPEDDNISAISLNAGFLEANLGMKDTKRKEFGDEIYSYVDVLKLAFDQKDFIDKNNIDILSVISDKINDVNTELIKIKIGVKARK